MDASAFLTIALRSVDPIPFVQVGQLPFVPDQWTASAVTAVRPDPNQKIEGNDMNSWTPVKPGTCRTWPEGRFIIFQTIFTPYAFQQKAGWVIVFKKVSFG